MKSGRKIGPNNLRKEINECDKRIWLNFNDCFEGQMQVMIENSFAQKQD